MSDSSEPAPLSKPRLEEARRLGYTPRSPELTAGVTLLATAWIGYSSLPRLVASLKNLVAESFQTVLSSGPMIGNLEAVGLEVVRIFAAAWTAALVLDLLQVGIVWSPVTPLPHEERINPVSGLQRLLGWSTWERATLLSLKLTLGGLLLAGFVWLGLQRLPSYADAQSLSSVFHWSCGLMAAIGGLCALTGIIDAVTRRSRWQTSLEQTDQERRGR